MFCVRLDGGFCISRLATADIDGADLCDAWDVRDGASAGARPPAWRLA